MNSPLSTDRKHMTPHLSKSSPALPPVCPCCGQAETFSEAGCQSCGARRVAEPLAQPDTKLPKLGAAWLSLSVCLVVIAAFLVAWIFNNDMKVGRVLLVWAFGDSLKVTRDLLRLDPTLPYYRIFAFDAYRLAFYSSLVLLPLSLLAIRLARRAQRIIKQSPDLFGGLTIARISLATSALLTIAFSTAVITSIPRAINNGREKRAAATRASMYQIGRLLREFNEAFGRYPRDLNDPTFAAFIKEPLPQADYWEKAFIYDPASLVASREVAIGFSNYRLVSAGPDGIQGNADDLVLQDGVIVSASAEPDPLPGLQGQEKIQP